MARERIEDLRYLAESEDIFEDPAGGAILTNCIWQ
jgi:hypothetical protein